MRKAVFDSLLVLMRYCDDTVTKAVDENTQAHVKSERGRRSTGCGDDARCRTDGIDSVTTDGGDGGGLA